MAKKKETGIDDLSYPDSSAYDERKAVSELSGNVTPAAKKSAKKGVSVAPQKRSEITGIEGETIYKNTGIDENLYGKAIYSDTYAGATPDSQGGTFDRDIKEFGIGVTDQETGVGTTPFSQTIQSPELQQKQGGIEMAGVSPVGTNSPMGKNQYGNVGQGTNGITVIGQQGDNWWKNQGRGDDPVSRARKIMKRMPYGSPGDRSKRRSMLEEARNLIAITGIESQGQSSANRLAFDYEQAGIEGVNQQRQFGIDDYNAMTNRINAGKPGKPVSQIGRFKTIAGEPILDEEGFEIGTSPSRVYDTTTGNIVDDRQAEGLPQNVPEGAAADKLKVRAGTMTREEFIEKYNNPGGA